MSDLWSRENLAVWSERAFALSARMQRFNGARVHLLAVVGGLSGLCLSVLAGTFILWAVVALCLVATAGVALLCQRRIRAVRRAQWIALALAPFFNQWALSAPEAYVLIATGLLLGLLTPLMLRGLGWILWYLTPLAH